MDESRDSNEQALTALKEQMDTLRQKLDVLESSADTSSEKSVVDRVSDLTAYFEFYMLSGPG